MGIGRAYGRHLFALNIRHFALGKNEECVDAVAGLKGFESRATGIT